MLPPRGMAKKLTPPPFTPGRYRHYKGWDYEAVGVVCHTETLEWYVLYKPLYPHDGMPDMWVRPYDMFMGTVEVDGTQMKRFTRL